MQTDIHLTTGLIGAIATVVVPVTGLAVTYMRLAMSNAIKDLKLDLVTTLNGTYTRKGECQLAHTDIKDWMTRVEKEVEKLDRHLSTRFVPLEPLTRSRREPSTSCEIED